MLRRTFLAGVGATAVGACVKPWTGAVPDSLAEAAYPPIGQVIEANGLKVHATDEGRGGPPVVLIHGAAVNLRDWTFSHTRRLAARHRVIAMDRPGFGFSERGPGTWTAARQAEQLRAAAGKMGAARPIVVGHSWGAIVALAWALDAPTEVSGVVCASGATMPWGIAGDIVDALGVGRIGAELYMSRLAQRADDGAVEAFVARAFTPQPPPAGYLDYVGAPLSLRAKTMTANSQDLAQTHAALAAQADRYRTLRLPVEVVHGEADWLLDVSQHAHGLAERLPKARVSVAEGVGHMAHHARPDLLDAAIARIAAAA